LGTDRKHFSASAWNGIRANHDVEARLNFDGVHIKVKYPTDDQVRARDAAGKTQGCRVQGNDGESIPTTVN